MTLSPPQKSNTSGLPQGAVLLTTLFTLYLPDMPHPPHTHLVFYVDDTALVSQSWQPDTISRRLGNAYSEYSEVVSYTQGNCTWRQQQVPPPTRTCTHPGIKPERVGTLQHREHR